MFRFLDKWRYDRILHAFCINPNNVDMGGRFSHSTVTINQNQDTTQSISNKHIEYEIDESTLATAAIARHKRNAAIASVPIIVAAIALLADLAGLADFTGLLSHFKIPKGMAIIMLIPICGMLAFIIHHELWFTHLSPDIANFRNGRWHEKLNDREVVSYLRRAKCIYPRCNGFVTVVEAPPKERCNHPLVGICSVGGIRHTYTIDFNSIGYPQQFDWSQPDQGKQA